MSFDIDKFKGHLRQQLENNSINPGTNRAVMFEYAFILGAIAAESAQGVQDSTLPPILTVTVMSGRSLLDEPV